MKQIPRVQKFMTVMPHSIGEDISIRTAVSMMRENHFRHLPVVQAGQLVGLLTDRDVKLASGFAGPSDLLVEEVMTQAPYTVLPEAPLDQVVLEMAEHKYGCAIVRQSNGKIVGIFTATDGLRVLGELMQANYKPAVA